MIYDSSVATVVSATIAILVPIIATAYNVGQLRQKIEGLMHRFDLHCDSHNILNSRLDNIAEDVHYLKGEASIKRIISAPK